MKSPQRRFKETNEETNIFNVVQEELWSLAVKMGDIIQMESHSLWYKCIERY